MTDPTRNSSSVLVLSGIVVTVDVDIMAWSPDTASRSKFESMSGPCGAIRPPNRTTDSGPDCVAILRLHALPKVAHNAIKSIEIHFLYPLNLLKFSWRGRYSLQPVQVSNIPHFEYYSPARAQWYRRTQMSRTKLRIPWALLWLKCTFWRLSGPGFAGAYLHYGVRIGYGRL